MERGCMDMFFCNNLFLDYQYGSLLDQWIIGCSWFVFCEYFISLLTTSKRFILGAIAQNVHNMGIYITSNTYLVLYYVIILFPNSSSSYHIFSGKVIQYFLYRPFSELVTLETYTCLFKYSIFIASTFISGHLLYVDLSHPLYSFMDFSLQ